MSVDAGSREEGAAVEPFGPDSIFWRFTGDWRQGYLAVRLFALQGSYPGIAPLFESNTSYHEDPYGRLSRTLTSVLTQVYGGPDAAAEGLRVRELHRPMKAVDDDGRHYSALRPDMYLWVHATTFEQAVVFYRLFDTPLTEVETEQLFQEWKRLGRMLGIREQHLPATLTDFWDFWDDGLGKLVRTDLIQQAMYEPPPPPPGFPAWLWPSVSQSFLELRRLVLAWTVPDHVRDILDLAPLTSAQLRKMQRLQRNSRLAGHAPDRLRYIPKAWKARQRALVALGSR